MANFTSASVSNGVAVTVSGLSLAGSASGNYSLSAADESDGEYHGRGSDDQQRIECEQQGV